MNDWSIQQIDDFLKTRDALDEIEMTVLSQDSRKGVQLAYAKWQRRIEKKELALAQFFERQAFEKPLHENGIFQIAGVDEVGRGPLAGPVVTAAVMLKPSAFLPESGLVGLNDSKQLSKEQRAHFVSVIKENALAYGIGVASAKEIDDINIYQATKLAMVRAVEQLAVTPEHLLLDAMNLALDIPQTSIIKGDARSLSIAAASVLAKEYRDDLMAKLDETYPGYQFSAHAGYATKFHLEAVEKLGPCPEHRLSFAPFKVG